MKDYIPEGDERFYNWQDNFMKVLVAKQGAWSVPGGDVTNLQTRQSDFVPKYKKANTDTDAKKSDRKARTVSRNKYEKAIRILVRKFIRDNDAVADDDKVALGVTVPDRIRSRKNLPGWAPGGFVKEIKHLVHRIRLIHAENGELKKRAKPPGVRFTRVYRCFSDEKPTDINQYTMIGTSNTAYFNSHFEEIQSGKRAWYILQYEGMRGQTGTHSEMFNGIVA